MNVPEPLRVASCQHSLCQISLCVYISYAFVSFLTRRYKSTSQHIQVQRFPVSPMAVSTKSTRRTLPFARSTLLRPIRAARLAHCDALDQWIGRADLSTASKVSLHGPLPAGQVMCRIFVVCLEVYFFYCNMMLCLTCLQRPLSPVYLLSMRAYEPRAGPTGTIRLARFTGFPGDADAPLWVRRLPPGKYLTFPQPRAFVANLVGGVSDIPVQSLIYVSFKLPCARTPLSIYFMLQDEITNEMRTWASITAVRLSRRQRSHVGLTYF